MQLFPHGLVTGQVRAEKSARWAETCLRRLVPHYNIGVPCVGNYREAVPNGTFAGIIVRAAQRIKYLGKGSFEPEIAFEIIVYKPLGLTATPFSATADKPEPTSGASASNEVLRLMTRLVLNPKWYSMLRKVVP